MIIIKARNFEIIKLVLVTGFVTRTNKVLLATSSATKEEQIIVERIITAIPQIQKNEKIKNIPLMYSALNSKLRFEKSLASLEREMKNREGMEIITRYTVSYTHLTLPTKA